MKEEDKDDEGGGQEQWGRRTRTMKEEDKDDEGGGKGGWGRRTRTVREEDKDDDTKKDDETDK